MYTVVKTVFTPYVSLYIWSHDLASEDRERETERERQRERDRETETGREYNKCAPMLQRDAVVKTL